tara:strand:+ start:257 stop:631 length:375 start_codon:yes stop_codon:yes gene_type:complete
MKSFSIQINNRIEKFKKKIQLDSGCKSISHRFFLIAARGTGISKAKNILESEDILVTIKALKKLGVKIFKKKKYLLLCRLWFRFILQQKKNIYLSWKFWINCKNVGRFIIYVPKKNFIKRRQIS